jgi:hypothetical protein
MTRPTYKFWKSWNMREKLTGTFFFAHSLSFSLPQVYRSSAWQKCPPDGVYCNHGCIMQVQFTFKELGMYLSRLHQSSFCPFSQLNEPFHMAQHCFLKIHFSIICESRPRNFTISRSFNYAPPFPGPECISLLLLTCHKPHPSHPPWFHYPNNFWWRKDQENPNRAIYSILLLLLPLQYQISSSAPSCLTSSAYNRPLI